MSLTTHYICWRRKKTKCFPPPKKKKHFFSLIKIIYKYIGTHFSRFCPAFLCVMDIYRLNTSKYVFKDNNSKHQNMRKCYKKICIWETLNLLTCADGSTNTQKKNKKREEKKFHEKTYQCANNVGVKISQFG